MNECTAPAMILYTEFHLDPNRHIFSHFYANEYDLEALVVALHLTFMMIMIATIDDMITMI